jgi:murein DD-endopeptidase MepM/ murein hydrolase activator NlpD
MQSVRAIPPLAVCTLFGPLQKLAIRADHPLSPNSPVKTHHLQDGLFGYAGRTNTDGTPRFHAGIDLVAPIGTSVYAVAPGRVEWIRPLVSGYGQCLLTSFRWRDRTLYYAFFAHLSHVLVKKHQLINVRDLIAKTGVSGLPPVADRTAPHVKHPCSTHPHLHLEIRTSPAQHLQDGKISRVDPRSFLGPVPFQQNTIDFLLQRQERTDHVA